MSKRKYFYYIVATEFGNKTREDYKEAFAEYKRSDSATLYGITTGLYNMEVIMSK